MKKFGCHAITIFSLIFISPKVFGGDFRVIESNSGIFFPDVAPQENQMTIGHTFLELAEWQKSPLYNLDRLSQHLSGKRLLQTTEAYILVTRIKLLIPIAPELIVTSEKFNAPQYHIDLNPLFNMEMTSQQPFPSFKVSRRMFGVVLETQIYNFLFTHKEITAEQKLSDMFNTSPNLYAVSVGFSSQFNHAIDRMTTRSEFYQVGNATLIETCIGIVIPKTSVTDGMLSGIFKSQIKSFMDETVTSSAAALYNGLKIK